MTYILCNAYPIRYAEYIAFNPTDCTINNKQSFVICYDPPTCFGFFKAINREGVYKGIQIQQIVSMRCMCKVKIRYCPLKLLQVFKI